jgi:hypothetical protein
LFISFLSPLIPKPLSFHFILFSLSLLLFYVFYFNSLSFCIHLLLEFILILTFLLYSFINFFILWYSSFVASSHDDRPYF